MRCLRQRQWSNRGDLPMCSGREDGPTLAAVHAPLPTPTRRGVGTGATPGEGAAVIPLGSPPAVTRPNLSRLAGLGT
jgi:hypothetical protein